MNQVSTNPLAARGLRPVAELAAGRGHGDRLRYMSGCRCFACRRANTAYEAKRKVARAAGEGNGIVPATKARAHLKALSALGVGRRSVAAASDVGNTVLSDIISGRKTNIRAATERAVLAVTADATGDRALVSAKQTWKMLDELIDDGYTRRDLAVRLGSKSRTPALQLDRDLVTARNAYLVERLYGKLKFECAKPTIKLLKKLREEGYTHHQVEQKLTELAAKIGDVPPVITPNKRGRISTKAADLMEQIFQELTA
ncbi:hypothetical protein [Massilia sp. YIM B02443]|uniref:hypothetical protein n=1 Tax=Massilia sp. YIM B02443 TaxID=3050127 RepID=UPI0025B70A74|nr:hypothetical protein [Massilia sp. YIM B02443]MDN4036771.1 hypothetical protein [Massilia sp. YIM B02443]